MQSSNTDELVFYQLVILLLNVGSYDDNTQTQMVIIWSVDGKICLIIEQDQCWNPPWINSNGLDGSNEIEYLSGT